MDVYKPDEGAQTLVEVLRRRAEEAPERRAYVYLAGDGEEAASLTYRELDLRARALAAWLQGRGLAGERVLLLYPQGLDFVAAFLGCLYAGAVAVPAYPPGSDRNLPRLGNILRDCRPALALTVASSAGRLRAAAGRLPEMAGLPWAASDEISQEMAGEWVPPAAGRESIAFLQYTSGSTSTPRGVRVLHSNLLHNEEMIRRAFGQSEESVIVSWLPLYHDMGLIGGVLQPLFVGAPCVLMSPVSFLQRPARWLEAVSRYRATTSGGPDFAYDLCARKIGAAERERLDLSSWTVAFNGSEPVRAATIERFSQAFGAQGFRREAFFPCYGLAEATLFVTGGSVGGVGPRMEGEKQQVSSGRVWTEMGQRVVVVEPESAEPLPANQVGEIWVAGPSVADGYWGRPEESERTFAARLADGDGPFLRTGDLGFLDGDGELFVTGRLKDLIILRGRNHYPQDIERTVEEAHPAVRPGAVAAFSVEPEEDGAGERLVVALELEDRRAGPDLVAALAEAARRAVAEMHEARVWEVVALRPGGLPRTSSGKLQRHACRAAYLSGTWETGVLGRSGGPEEVEAAVEAGALLSREELLALPGEERVPRLAAEVLARAARALRAPGLLLAAREPLTGAGLDSLAAVELQHGLAEDFGAAPSLGAVLAGASAEQIAAEMLARLEGGASVEDIPETAREGDEVPLSYGQRALWFLEKLNPGTTAFVLAGAAEVRGDLDETALGQALERVVERHGALRMAFREVGGRVVQRVSEPAPFLTSSLIQTPPPGGEGPDSLEDLLFRPFDLETGRPIRAGVIREDGRTVLWLAVHHLVADLWSLGILLREWEALYLEETTGRPARLAPAPALGFPDYVRWQQRQLAGPEGERLWSFWRERLASPLPVLDLPTDRPRPAVQTHRGDSVAQRWPAAAVEAVREMGRSRGATLYASLLAGLSALLHRYTGQEDLLLGSPTTGRSSAGLAGVVGYFIDPVVIRADASGEPSFENLLERTRTAVLEAFEHTGYPFPLLAERLQPERDPSRSPVFQVFFVLERARQLHERGFSAFALGEAGARMEWAGLRLTSLALPRRSAQFDLMILVAELPDGELALSLEYNADLFDAGTVRRMLGHFRTLIEGAAAEPGRPVGMLPLLTPAEREQLLGNATVSASEPATLVERFEEWARRAPDAVAVVHELEELTYARLDEKAERLARSLRRRGVGPDVLVGLSVERSLELVVGILGILKAGGAYVPLDPSYPRERLDFMVADAGVALVVDGKEDGDGGDFLGDSLKTRPLPANLAYVIYTSGSTGRPKGVMVTHGNAARLFDALAGPLGLGPGDVWTLFHSYAFDFSVWEIWGALALGGRLVIVPYRTSRSPEELHELLATEGVTVLAQTPSAFRQLVAAEEEMGPAAPALRKVIFGGEALDLAALRPWFARHGDTAPELWNLYGITETTVHVTLRRITAQDAAAGGPSRIGRPMADLRVFLLDRRLELVPEGVPGEIWVGGAGLARGYLGRPDLTAERFRPDPWSGAPGERLYKSGDLARRRSGGDLEYLGRADHQVKVRGHRIEPGEVEAALAAHPAVAQAVVGVKEHGPGDRRLVAWMVLQGEADPAELRDFLRERLPEPLVPSAFVIVPELPLTPSGKVDRGALEELETTGDGLQEKVSVVAPRTSSEAALAEIWADLLGVEVGSVEDGFFDLGGHSLLATQMLSRVRSALGVDLPIAAVFETPTVAGLAAAAEAARGGMDQVSRVPPIRPARRGEAVPLSFAQQRLWFLHQLDPDVPAYNVPAVFRLRGELRISDLARALQGILDRHEALRTGFSAIDGQPVQTVGAGLTIALPVIDLAGLPEPLREAERARIAHAEAWTPFDLEAPPLCRVRLLRLGERDHALLVVLHHIAADGWSIGVFLRELAALYAGSELPELPVQYADYAVWQHEWLRGEALEAQLGWWRERLSGAPSRIELPADRPRPPVPGARGRNRRAPLPAGLAADLAPFARQRGATPFMVLLSAFYVLLHRYTGATDLVVGTPIANRHRGEVEGLIGFFVNTLALRGDLSGEPLFGALLRRVRREVLGAYEHQDLPFEKVVEDLQPGRDLARTPLFQVMFALQNAPLPALTLPAAEIGLEPVASGLTNFDLTVDVFPEHEGFTTSADFSAELFDPPTIERFLAHFSTLLAGAVEDPGRSIAELPLLTAPELQQTVIEWNDTGADTLGLLAQERFERQAAATPEAPAVISPGGALSYGDLDRRANRLAWHLRGLRVGPEVRVGLQFERSPELMVAILAVLKAGGAFVLLDPDYPAERLEWVREDFGRGSAAPVVLTADSLRTDSWEALPDTPLPRDAGPESTAYVLYTSGSTGRPKGAVNSHRGFARFIENVARRLDLRPCDRFLQFAAVGFDVLLEETFPVWSVGGAVVLRDRDALTALPDFGRILAEDRVTAIELPSAFWHEWVDELARAGERPPESLRLVIVGGERVSPRHVEAWGRWGVPLWNVYGLTEAAVTTSLHRLFWEGRAGEVSIGRPLAGQRMHVLDAGLRPLPAGVPGELCVAGDGLARGYLHRPDLTAERFVPDSVGEEPGGRLYRTGDRARFRPDGEVEILGRIDRQVKVHGVRVEPGEVEAALEAHPAVRQAVVLARPVEGGMRLAAYVVAEPTDAASLRAFLRKRLPEALVPSSFVFRQDLPVNPHGKVDRAALAALPLVSGVAEQGEVPRTAAEEALARVWAEVLGRPRVGRDDNFFELGGDSILSIQLVARARRAGWVLTPRQVFQHQTVAELAAVAEPVAAEAVPAAAEPVIGRVPLTPIQRWFFAQDLPDPHHWAMPVLLDLAESLDPVRLQQALALLARRHDALRLRFRPEGQGWIQELPAREGGAADAPVTVVDLTALPEAMRQDAFRAASGQAHASFDLAEGPLLRAVLLGSRLLLTAHHLIVDGVSWRVLLEDLQEAYERGEAAVPPVPVPFSRWAVLQAEQDGGPERADVQPLPRDFPAGENTVASAGVVTVALTPEATGGLIENGVDEAFLRAVARAVAEWTGDARVILEREGHGREGMPGVDLSRTVGWFTRLEPVVVEVGTGETWGGGSSPSQGGGTRPPRAEILVNYLGRLDRGLPAGAMFRLAALAPEEGDPALAPGGRRPYVLEVNAGVLDDRLQVSWTYGRKLHRRETVENLAAVCLAELERLATARDGEIEDVYPLTPMQEGMLLHSRMEPGLYQARIEVVLEGALDEAALAEAWRRVSLRHPPLRTAFRWEGLERPEQVVYRAPVAPPPTLPRSAGEGAAPPGEEEVGEEVVVGKGGAGQRTRVEILRQGEQVHRMVWRFHQAFLDGWSVPVVLGEVFAVYGALARGEEPRLPPARPFRDYLDWLRRQDFEAAGEVWRRELAGFRAPTPVGVELPRGEARPFERESRLSEAVTAGLQAAARRHGLTLSTLLQGAWAVLLARYAGEEDVVFGGTVSGRPPDLPGVEAMVGLFINTLPVRAAVRPDEPLSSWLPELQERQTALRDLAFLPLAEIQRGSGVPAGEPLFQSFLVFQNYPVDESLRDLPGGLRVSGFAVEESANYPVVLMAVPGRELALQVHGDGRRLDAADGARLLGHLETLLAGISRRLGDARIGDLPLLTEAERHQMLVELATAALDFDREILAHERVAAWARETPEAPAVTGERGSLTYGELNARANRLARRLRRLGVVPETRVAICLDRSPDLVTAALAVLKAGGAYVPLDPSYPVERLGFQIGDSLAGGLRLVLTREAFRDRLPAEGFDLIDVERLDLADESPADLPRIVDSENCAYVIYTSGSTGWPKGVEIRHAGLANLVAWHGAVFGFRPGDRGTFAAGPAFDASVFEMWSCLAGGATLCAVADEVRSVPDRFAAWIVAERITVCGLATALAEPLLEGDRLAGSALRLLCCGGDRLRVRPGPRHAFRMVNLYGPTESTVNTSWGAVAPEGEAEAGEPRLPPIGRPTANLRLHLLDGALQPVPLGVAAELWIGGDGLARGYLRRPDLTADRFRPDPFRAGERLYRTGDLCRYLRDGRLEFVGRTDGQVKVRGVRVEPGEVEAVLGTHPAVRQAVVLAPEIGGERRLVACVAAGETADLRAWLRAKLPEAAVPSSFVFLEAFPLTPNGKLDLEALEAQAREAGRERRPVAVLVAPRTPTEEILAGIWTEVLGTAVPVGIRDDFFDLGRHSLLAARVAARIHQTLGVDLPLADLFAAPTVEALAARCTAAAAGPSRPLHPLAPAASAPLSFAQQRLWFLDQLDPESTVFVLPAALRLAGRLDPVALAASLGEIVRRHQVLRTRFPAEGGEPVQVVAPWTPPALPLLDLAGLPPAVGSAEARRLAEGEARRPFDLRRGPVLRLRLARLSPDEHLLLLTLHHIVADGWSVGVIAAELSALYRAFTTGEPPDLPELPVQYADFAIWQREELAAGALEPQLAYWRRQLAGAPPHLELPADRPRPAIPSGRGARASFLLPAGLTEDLRRVARQEGATLFMVLLAAFQLFLSRHSGHDDVSVGTPVAGRGRVETEGLVGCFLNTLVLRADLSGDPPFRSLLARVRATALAAFAHAGVPFERLVEELQPERDLGRTPLFQAMLSLQSSPLAALELPGLRIAPLAVETGTAELDVLVEMVEEREGLSGVLQISADLFDLATGLRWIERFRTLLEGVAAHAGDTRRRLSALPILPESEAHQALREWNAVPDAEGEGHVHELFAAQAERTPDAPALISDEGSRTYAELRRDAGRIARRLAALGVGPESRVAICAGRSFELIAGLLGILEAGGAYLPLDPSHPADRLAYVLEDSGTRVLLADPGFLESGPLAEAIGRMGRSLTVVPLTPWPPLPSPSLPPGEGERGGKGVVDRAGCTVQSRCVEVLSYHDAGSASFPLSRPGGGRWERGPGGEGAAYLLYTSGSTGRPRGVIVDHDAFTARLLYLICLFGLGPGDRHLQFVSLSFDVAGDEIFTPLICGAAVALVPEPAALTPAELAGAWERLGVTRAVMSPALWHPVPDGLAAAGLRVPESLRTLGLVGEAPVPAKVAAWLRLTGPGHRFLNLYGPTEATIYVTVEEVEREPDAVERWERLSIGRPMDGVRVYLLDRAFRAVPPGAAGELCLGGAGLARGYLGRPEVTAERFIPDPWSVGERLYRTGDLARQRADGRIDFLGRLDFQVKVRGVRIELGEVEAALAAHAAVRESAVIAVPDGTTKRLVAFYSVRPDAPLAPDPRAFLLDRLPEVQVPTRFVELAALPLTPNGKVDRRALALLWDREEDATGDACVAPRNPTEAALAEIWAHLLGADRIGVEDDFFALGGHSLIATRLIARVREAFGVEVPLRRLFERPTVAGLATAVASARRSEGGEPPLVPVPRTEELPLSFAQQRLWFLSRLEPDSPSYNIPGGARFVGDLDVATAAACLSEIVRRQESLRTRFVDRAGRPVQEVLADRTIALPLVDLRGLPAAALREESARIAAEEGRRPFDLERDPLLRPALLRTADREHLFLLTFHHIVADGWSLEVFLGEMAALYAALAQGESPALPELPVQYADHAVWQRRRLAETGALAAHLAWWKERLAGLPPVLELPADRPRPAVQSYRGASWPLDLPPALAAELAAFGRRSGLTSFAVLLAAVEVLLARLTGRDDFAVGSPVANRDRPEIEGLVGFFANTLVLRADLSGSIGFAEATRRASRAFLEAHDHRELPFERLVEELQPERSLAYSPLFQVMVAVYRGQGEPVELPGLRMEPLEVGTAAAPFDLTFTFHEAPGRLEGALLASRDRFDRTTAQRIAGAFQRLLAAALAEPERPFADLDLLAAEERQQLLVEWNDSDSAELAAGEGGVHTLFEAQARRTPDAVAVVCEGERLTYGELDRRAERLAGYLARLGVGPDVPVAIAVERSAGMAVAVLGVLKAGGAYVPLDPSYPEERLAWMAQDAGAPVLLTEPEVIERLPLLTARHVVEMANVEGAPSQRARIHPDHLAYLIYTSGSTGRPKGIGLPHRALANLLHWHVRRVGPGVMLQLASLSFDASFLELLGAWAAGGSVVIVLEEARRDVPALAALLRRERVTQATFPVVVLQQLAELSVAEGPLLLDLRDVVATGEQLQVTEPLRRMFAGLPAARFSNFYGPSETHGVAFWTLDGPPAGWPGLPPIGRPLPNTGARILDRNLEPVPPGVPAELFLSGISLARGYHNRPDLTAERFLPDPFGGPGARMYRTGDLARFRMDGALEYLGRSDTQVKIRGFRVEVGEVEAQLGLHPVVREAAVVAKDGGVGKRLVAFLAGDGLPADPELRSFLAARLPDYMVPAAFVRLPALPLTPNRKVDRRALADLPEARAGSVSEAPRTPAEEIVAGAWAEVLAVPAGGVGVHESFFAQGGHSLLATRVMVRLRQAFGVELPLRTLFERPTVVGLAAAFEAARGVGSPARPPLQPRAGEPARLSHAQERLWFLDRLEPGSAAYNLPAAVRIEGALEEAALEGALREIVRRHESLRTVFPEVQGRPAQRIEPPDRWELPRVDLSALPPERREAAAIDLADEDARRPFDLAAGPLLRTALLRLDREAHVLLLNLHHAVADERSIAILLEEMAALYPALADGRPPSLPGLPVQYGDFSAWQRDWLAGGELEAQLGWWRERFTPLPEPLSLPVDRPRTAAEARGGFHPFVLPADLSREARALGQRTGSTLFMVLLAAFEAQLARLAHQEDVVVGTPVAGRLRPEVEGLIGFFVNTLALRTDLGGDPPFAELLARVRETALGAWDHQDLPFEKLVEELQPDRGSGRTPLFQVVFTLHGATALPEIPGLALSPIPLGAGEAKFDLLLELTDLGDAGLAGSLQYDAGLFDAPTAGRLAGGCRELLAGAVADPAARLADLPLLPEAERHQLLVEWAEAREEPAHGGLHELFEAQAERRPEAVAVVCGEEALTYGELRDRARELACQLREQGAGPDVLVGLRAERSLDLIVGIVGILMAGAAYVPLDPSYPEERLRFLVEDAGVSWVVEMPRRGDVGVARAGSPGRGLEGESDSHLAYVIYTSGSTGRPKGVLVTHENVVRLLESTRERFRFGEGDVWTLFHSFAFDFSVWEIWGALAYGGKLVVVPWETSRSPRDFRELLVRAGVTVLNQTPSAFRQLLPHLDGSEPLRWVIFGGEALDSRALGDWPGSNGPRAVNMYGITETTVHVTFRELGSGDRAPALGSSVGRPLADLRVHLLDRGGRPVPVGVPGEIHVGGPGLARGYHRRPDLTAERFVPSPWGGRPGERLYRSGDLARWRADGELELLGRIDQQVKIRGFRIELAEVEAALLEHPGVQEAAVVAAPHGGSDRLVAYVVPGAGEPDPGELRAFAASRLPDYMVPAAWVVLEALPLTAHGKLDRKALPAPEGAASSAAAGYLEPRDAVERLLAGAWAEALGVERVGVHDSFFDLGGHSLLAVQMISWVRETFEVEVPLRDLFESPTVTALAAALVRDGEAEARVRRTAELMLEMAEMEEEDVRSELVGETVALEES